MLNHASTPISLFFSLLLTLVLSAWSLVANASGTLEINVVDQSGQPVEHAVVTLKPLFDYPTAKQSASQKSVSQQNAQFQPFVTPVTTGSTVYFPNLDEFRHHVYYFSKAKKFQLQLYGQDETKFVTLEKPGVVALGCNIHDNMLAFVYVTDHPIQATSNSSGAVVIEELISGNYEVHLWHPDLTTRNAVQLATQSIEDKVSALSTTLTLKSVRRMQHPPAEEERY